MILHDWGVQWNIPAAAIEDLMRRFSTMPSTMPTALTATSETPASNAVALAASTIGARLWRNNIGAYKDATGRWIRYGLCNESKAMNQNVKSSDRIGIRPIRIGPQHDGMVIGQFFAREVKRPGWVYKATKHERAQLRFIEIVTGLGGDAKFTTGEGEL